MVGVVCFARAILLFWGLYVLCRLYCWFVYCYLVCIFKFDKGCLRNLGFALFYVVSVRVVCYLVVLVVSY